MVPGAHVMRWQRLNSSDATSANVYDTLMPMLQMKVTDEPPTNNR